MEEKDAINILIQVAVLAQTKGILTLDEAVVVKQSIDTLQQIHKEDTKE